MLCLLLLLCIFLSQQGIVERGQIYCRRRQIWNFQWHSLPRYLEKYKVTQQMNCLREDYNVGLNFFYQLSISWTWIQSTTINCPGKVFCLQSFFLKKITITTKLMKFRLKNVTFNEKGKALGILTHIIIWIVRCDHFLWFSHQKWDSLVFTSVTLWRRVVIWYLKMLHLQAT